MKFKDRPADILLKVYVIAVGIANCYLWGKAYSPTWFNGSSLVLPFALVVFALFPGHKEDNLIRFVIKWGSILMLTFMLIIILVMKNG